AHHEPGHVLHAVALGAGEADPDRYLGVATAELAQRRAADRDAHEGRHFLGAESERRGPVAVDLHRQLGVAVAHVHAHVAQLFVARQLGHHGPGQVHEALGRITDQLDTNALVIAALPAVVADADVGARRLRQRLADLLDQRTGLADLAGVELQLRACPALFA